MSYAIVEFTCGTPGSGKSFTRGAERLVEFWLVEEDGAFISNFPYNEENRENMALYLCEAKKIDIEDARAEIARRVVSIPDTVKRAWMEGTEKPLEYFKRLGQEVTGGAHIAIDEIHNYCPVKAPPVIEQAWAEFVGEIRHIGATLEVLSQDEFQINQVIRKRAELKRFIVKRESELVPYIKIPVGDLMQFVYKFRGRASQVSRVYEYKKVSDKEWVLQRDYNVPLLAKYFKYYDSFSAPEKSKGMGSGKSRRQPWEKYSWPGLVLWFLRVHYWRAVLVAGAFAFLIWFLFMGGLPRIISGFSSAVTDALMGGMVGGLVTEPSAQTATLTPEELAHKERQEKERLAAEVKELQRRTDLNKSTLEEYARLKAEFERMQEVKAIFTDGVLLNDGTVLRKGKEIVYGKYKGVAVEWVDIPGARVGLTDGVVLRLSLPRGYPETDGNEPNGAAKSGDAGGVQRGNSANNGKQRSIAK